MSFRGSAQISWVDAAPPRPHPSPVRAGGGGEGCPASIHEICDDLQAQKEAVPILNMCVLVPHKHLCLTFLLPADLFHSI
eukprot:9312418-Pyramimonas_sp.AAC.1